MFTNKGRKLALNRKTIRALATNEMKAVAGGFMLNQAMMNVACQTNVCTCTCNCPPNMPGLVMFGTRIR